MFYTGTLTHRMTLRLDDELKEKIERVARVYHVSPSDYIRQSVAQAIRSYELAEKAQLSILNGMAEVGMNEVKEGLENGTVRKTDSDNLV